MAQTATTAKTDKSLPPARFVRTRDLAAILHVSLATAKDIVARGEIATIRLGSKILLIPVDELERYVAALDARRTQPINAVEKKTLSKALPAQKAAARRRKT